MKLRRPKVASLGSGELSLVPQLAKAFKRFESSDSADAVQDVLVDVLEKAIGCEFVGVQTLVLPDLELHQSAANQAAKNQIMVCQENLQALVRVGNAACTHNDFKKYLTPRGLSRLFNCSKGISLVQGALFVRPREDKKLLDLTVLGAQASEPRLSQYAGFVDVVLRFVNNVRLKQTGATRLKQEHLRVIQAKMEWQSSVDVMGQIICLVNRDGSILRANKALEHFGLAKVTTVQGQSIVELLDALISCTSSGSRSELAQNIWRKPHKDHWNRRWKKMAERGMADWQEENLITRQCLKVTMRPCELKAIEGLESSLHAVVVIEDVTTQQKAQKLVTAYKEELETAIKRKTVELKRANRELRRLSEEAMYAQENERARVARELHDSIGQSLMTIKLYVESLLGGPARIRDGQFQDDIERLRERVCNAIRETRRISMDLRPPMLDDLGLAPTLTWFFREFQHLAAGLSVISEITIDEKRLSAEQKTAIFRVIQEALNNAFKHANASVVRVYLGTQDGGVTLTIEDDGQGCDIDSHLNRGCGLSNMKQRVSMTGGQFALSSGVGEGVSIVAHWT